MPERFDSPTPRQAQLISMARAEGCLPATVRVGDRFQRVPMLMFDGHRFQLTAHDHTLIEIVAVPGGRRKLFSYVKLDAKGMGNGRADRGLNRCGLSALARHYKLVAAAPSEGDSK